MSVSDIVMAVATLVSVAYLVWWGWHLCPLVDLDPPPPPGPAPTDTPPPDTATWADLDDLRLQQWALTQRSNV
jgi:hypothetical protein